MKKKKVIFCTYNLDIGGIERAILNYIKGIDKKKYDVYLMLEKKEGIYLDEVQNDIKIINYNINCSKNIIIRKISNAFKLLYLSIRYYNKFDFSACFATYLKGSAILAKRFSKNNALWVHGEYWNDTKTGNAFLKRIRADKYKKIIFVANKLKNNYLELRPNTKQKLYVINNPIDYISMINKSKEKLDIKKSKFTFLNVGRHEEYSKRLTLLINTVSKLVKNGYDFDVWLIGDGPENELYKKLVSDLKLESNIKFFGKKSNVFPYYKLCDCVVLSSYTEGNPVVYLEAKVMNKPVISTNVSDAKIELEGYGLVTEFDKNSFYNGLKQILDNGYIINKKFNPEKYNKNVFNMLYDLIEDR